MSVDGVGHPVRLVLTDDLRRSRLTVFFRLLLAIPHYFWFFVFSFGALLVAPVGWVSALVTGRLPGVLHGFLAAYVRYSAHLFAYLSLAANPYPGFAGDRGYPVDVEIGPPVPQRRLSVLFRWLLALPAALVAAVLLGAPTPAWGGDFVSDNGPTENGASSAEWSAASSGAAGAIWTVAFLGWFVILVRGRMPHGFRNLAAYGVEYGASAAAYALLLTGRYPTADPTLPAGAVPPTAHPVDVADDGDARQSRLTVFFRLFLAIPHLIWLTLWTVPALVAAVLNWLVTFVAGRSPRALHRFLSAYVRYRTHVTAYLFVVTRQFPGFTGGTYPLAVVLPEPERQSRPVTAFRLLLALPALVVSGALAGLLLVAGFLGWFYALAKGRSPTGLREAALYTLRYGTQATAYTLVLTDRYPHSSPPVAVEPLAPAADAPA